MYYTNEMSMFHSPYALHTVIMVRTVVHQLDLHLLGEK